MIICISGGVGSGKSATAVKHALEESKSSMVLTNFMIKGIKNYYRLKKVDVIQIDTTLLDGCRKLVEKKSVNWDFWEAHRNSDVFLDEVHNLVSSRNSMSKTNQIFSEWLSQIRKIWGSSGDQNLLDVLRRLDNKIFTKVWPIALARSRNLYYITQKERKADINFRELTHVHVRCKKKIINGHVIIFNLIWFGTDTYDAFEMEEMGVKPKIHVFCADEVFKHYDSYEIIRGQGDYL